MNTISYDEMSGKPVNCRFYKLVMGDIAYRNKL
jgi:hypothetical protein